MITKEPNRRWELLRLLHRRNRLATAAIEHLAHDLPGADLLWQEVHKVEERVRIQFPAVWAIENASWVVQDGERLHTADSPRPADCRICAAQARLSVGPRAA
ncbi:hypothetical protein [Cellulomonas terrae]|uniref:Uncharacterized protein n=1 Tax=Cellulomonas terrae TaxID=311234 RepID=A0A511JPA0_9CELL|nr:hypothetical protein [Cellulomonas terrae]GEL99769.1 hypothetical protein CTE05_33160 [Cellulomonas terrae]